MKKTKQSGFSMVEFLVASAISLLILGVAVAAFSNSVRTSEMVALNSDLNDNLRASMDLMSRDLLLTGAGIPTSGISVPSGITISRPNLTATTFSAGTTSLAAVTLGTGLGPKVVIYNTPTSSVTSAATDILTLLYEDNTWNVGESMDFAPINRSASGSTTACNGTISANGDTVAFDQSCNDLTKTRVPIQPGDLIMFTNPSGLTCIQTVTTANGQTLNFAANTTIDKFGFNQTGASSGTIVQLQNVDSTGKPNGTYPPITATRIFMVTYFIDNVADALRPRLMRQVNFLPAQPVGDVLEVLQVTYNFVDGNTPPTFYANQNSIPAGLNANFIRSANIFLGARSNKAYSKGNVYFRDNLTSQVSFRSLSYFNRYQ